MDFKKLMKENPRAAKKHIEDFKDNIFWEYFKATLIESMQGLHTLLISCDIEDVKEVRGKLKAYGRVAALVDLTLSKIIDEITLQEDAEKVEEARKL